MKLDDKDNVVPSSKCLSCSHRHDRATCVGDEGSPSPGDVTVCIRCGHIMAFSTDLSLRELNDEEMHAIAGDKRVLVVQLARKELLS